MHRPVPPLAADVFHTQAWFDHLLASGFVQPPAVQCLPLVPGEADPARAAVLPLMALPDGTGLGALSNYYSGLFGPVDVGGALAAMSPLRWREAAEALRRLPGGARLQLQPLDADAPWLAQLEQGLQACGYRTDRYFCFGNWYQPVAPGGFAAYWSDRPSSLRHSVARGRKRLDKAGRWEIEIVVDESQRLDAVLSAYQAVYAQSWKSPEPCPDFMPGLVRLAAREGWLRLGVLWLDGRPLAAQVWLVHGRKANIYKLAYVRGQEKFSAGSVLTAALMERAMDVDRVTEVDYLSGDDAYKADWMARRRERVGLVAFDLRRWRGMAGAAHHLAGRLWQHARAGVAPGSRHARPAARSGERG
jgi:hypothetical protein